MITLATLGQATAQEVYNQVKEHLLRQGEPSKDKNHKCCYRNGTGLKCAAGALIADEEYLPEMDKSDNSSWTSLIIDNVFPSTRHDALITSLQILHDNFGPTEWEGKLLELAMDYDLEP